MSQENVEIVRRFYEGFNRSGRPELDILDPEVVWYQPDEIGGGEGSYHGHEGVLRAVREMHATFDHFQAIPEKFIEVGGDRVLVLARHGGTGRGSGVHVDAPVGHVLTLHDGKVIEWRAYLDRTEALEAVGLSEQDPPADSRAMATKAPVPATHNRDTPGVIAPPPFIYLAALGIGVGIDAILPSVSLPAGVRWSVGTLAVLLGLWLMRSFVQAFRRADTAVNPFRPTSAIATDGPYKFTRNPGYLGMALVCGGAAVLLDAIWALPVVAGAMVVIDRGVIAREERYLDAKFGAEYRAYRSQVRRWV